MFTHLHERSKFTENEARIYIGEIVLALEKLHSVSFSMYGTCVYVSVCVCVCTCVCVCLCVCA